MVNLQTGIQGGEMKQATSNRQEVFRALELFAGLKCAKERERKKKPHLSKDKIWGF